MTGAEIAIALPIVIAGIEMVLGAIPNRYVPYKSRILKVLSYVKFIGPFLKKINDK